MTDRAGIHESRKLAHQFAQSLLSDRATSSHRRERQVTHSRIESDILLIEYQTFRVGRARGAEPDRE